MLSEVELNETLERFGVMADAQRPGCYAIELQTPSDHPKEVRNRWESEFVVEPPKGLIDRLASASRFCYVGSHGQNVYDRLTEHCAGQKTSTIMAIWPPVDVVAIWPDENAKDYEYTYAIDLADDQTCVWVDGEHI